MLTQRLILTLTLSACCLLPSQAQDSLLLHDYQFVKRSDAWLTSINSAALTRLVPDHISTAQLSLTHAKGGFADFFESPSVLQADATVESFTRLSQRAVVFGQLSYGNYSGRHMAGSAFIRHQANTHLPFDLVEDSLMNTGTKHRDIYHLHGGFGVDIWRGLSLGASLDYTAANYAKYKDLRHKNKLMDLTLSTGLYLPVGPAVQLGACYVYRRTTQSVQFSTYGKSDRVYKTFINYGPYIGQVEQYGSEGYTDKSRTMPLVDDYDGLSAQLAVSLPHVTTFHSFTYAHRRGYYGSKSPYTITYSHHRSHLYDYNTRLTLQGARSRYHLDFSLQAEKLQNQANNYRELQNDASANYYEYYAPTKLADRLWVDGEACMTAHLAVRQALPTWTLKAGISWAHRKQTAYLYPYYRRQHVNSHQLFASVLRNVVTPHGVWTLTLDAAFRQGGDEPFQDLTFAAPSDKSTPPATMEAYMWREYLWLTAPQYAIGGAVRYSFMLPVAGLKTYVQASTNHRKANCHNDFLEGRDRTTLCLALGCEF